MIKVEHLSKSFGANEVLKKIDMEINQQELLLSLALPDSENLVKGKRQTQYTCS